MGDEEDSNGKVPWRAVTLWGIASVVGGTATYAYSLAGYVSTIREQQVINTRIIDDHARRLDVIESSKVDKRFRSDDWERERRVLDAEFKSLWKAVEDCKKPQRM